jgi:hypothetical protein
MDPFLEDSSEWSNVHTRLITAISDQLAGQLAPHFSVKIESRVYITSEDAQQRFIEPDLYLIQMAPTEERTVGAPAITTPVMVESLYESETLEHYIEIRDKRSRAVITTIELLSPYNKSAGTPGSTAFISKRQMVMSSDVHWVEIDLLRGGERPAEVAGKSDYYALLKRGGTLGQFAVWYFEVRDRMPTIAVPLCPPFEDVPLDLQAAFEDMYTRAYFADDIDYSRDIPLPVMRPADQLWGRAQITAWQAQRGPAA